MVARTTLVLLLACVCTNAIPRTPPVLRNTIFADERVEGGVFENVDAFDNIELSPRNATSPYRLPTTTKPIHYDVVWHIDINNLQYQGSVDIQIQATKSNVSQIVIHYDHMPSNPSVTLRLGANTIQTSYELEPAYQFLKINLLNNAVLQYTENAQTQTTYLLTVEFGFTPMRTDMYGIYRSWFKNAHNQAEQWMASTQFQATAARYAFPCYDEPGFKATFKVTIRRPTNLKSWFCTLRESTTPSVVTGYTDDVYQITPVMSTYLLALIVADYESDSVSNNNGILQHEVIARPGAMSAGQGKYALETGISLLNMMNNHTAYNFYDQSPSLKMTQAAIPDFGAGAMENWGLLTYREAYLMLDDNHTNSYYRQLIAYILSHEIAHMWFGNLVTNQWWDVLWLNEGFARYYQYFLTEWTVGMGLGTRFITEQVHTSLLSDSSNNPQPLTNPGVGSPAAVSAMFSTITYNKGAAVIRMTEHLLGSVVHTTGLRNYLKKHHFGLASPQDLFDALDDAGTNAGAFTAYGNDFSLSEYYRSWTEQPGHPVLFVYVDHASGEMTITQRRFNINTGISSRNTNYVVPITFVTGANPDFSNPKPTHIMRKSSIKINRQVTGDHWVLFNTQQTGFYRVNYDDYTWDLIIQALRGPDRTKIHEYNKAQIVNDVFQFARSGLMSYERAFNILSFLQFETEYAPWVAALTGFSWIRNRLANNPTELAQINTRIQQWSAEIMGQLGYTPIAGEEFMRSYLRYQMAPVMCNIGVSACLTAANTQFNNLRQNNVEVPVDNRNWVYCNALRNGNQEDYNFLRTRFFQHNVYTEKILILGILGCTTHEASLNSFMNEIVSDNFIIRPQDYNSAFNSAVTGNEINTQRAFRFVQDNLPRIISAFGSPVTPLSYISSRLRTNAEVQAFQTWATANQATLGTHYNSVLQGVQNSVESIQWVSEVQEDLNSYFVNGDAPISTTTSTQAPVTVQVTSTRVPFVNPGTPTLPVADSAATSLVSICLLAVAAIANIIL
nr:aminopeptidase N3 [Trichoplusia ni]